MKIPEWTTVTPDGRRVIVKRRADGWTVACNDSESTTRSRLEVALIEAILIDDDFALHSMRFDYAIWSRQFAEQIESDLRPPDPEPSY
jgi:hypothetical protein